MAGLLEPALKLGAALRRFATRNLNLPDKQRSNTMQVILLERIGRLGQMGDVVNVKNGYARNFLLPQKKALRGNAREPGALREGSRPARGARPRAQEGSRGRRRQARRARPSSPSARQATPASSTARSPRATSPSW